MANYKSMFLIALGGFAALSEATRKKPKNFIMVSLISCTIITHNWKSGLISNVIIQRLSRKFSFTLIPRAVL